MDRARPSTRAARAAILLLLAWIAGAAEPFRQPATSDDPILLVPGAVVIAEATADLPVPGTAGTVAPIRTTFRVVDAVMFPGPESLIVDGALLDVDIAAPIDGRAETTVAAISGHDSKKARVSLRTLRGAAFDDDARRGLRCVPAAGTVVAVPTGHRCWIRIAPIARTTGDGRSIDNEK